MPRYSVLHRAVRRLCVIGLALVAVGCGGSTEPSGPANIAGIWTFTDAISNSQLSASCNTTASANVIQSGSTFTGTTVSGTQTCTVGTQVTTGSVAGTTFNGGQINGSSVSFIDSGGCSYTGTLSGNPANRMSGNETCSVAISGTNYQFTGTWQASR